MSAKIAIAAAVAAAVGLGAGALMVAMGGKDGPFADCQTGAVAGGSAQIGGAFTLTDETGARVTDTQVIDGPTLVYFGYTYCPDICPTDTARNAEAVTLLEARGIMVKPVMITIDPERDTPEVLAEFTDYIHPRMLGLTGSEDEIAAVARAYKTYYRKQDSEDEYYLMDHLTLSYLMLPEHGFVEFFKRDDSAQLLADRMQCFIDAV